MDLYKSCPDLYLWDHKRTLLLFPETLNEFFKKRQFFFFKVLKMKKKIYIYILGKKKVTVKEFPSPKTKEKKKEKKTGKEF